MIKIKLEVNDEEEEEKEVTPLPIENENKQIKELLSLNCFDNNNFCLSTNLDNFTTDSVVAFGSKSIETKLAESALSLTTQLNYSLNIQSLLRQQRIQNGWTTNEQSIPIGTQQQQQQSLFLSNIEPIVPENQEVPLSLDQSSLISNLNFHETTNYDTTEVPLSLDQSSSSISNSAETTTTNCDIITTEMFSAAGLRAGFGRKAKLNVCYTVPKNSEPVSRRLQQPLFSQERQRNSSYITADNGNSESTNDIGGCFHSDQDFGFGSISGVDPSSASSTAAQVAAPSAEAVPLLVGKKPLRRVPPLTLEEKKARKKENDRLSFVWQKAKPVVDPEVEDEKIRRKREYHRKWRQQLLASATPEQREQRRLKELENVRRQRKNESEEQRERRLERVRQYARTVGKQRKEQRSNLKRMLQKQNKSLEDQIGNSQTLASDSNRIGKKPLSRVPSLTLEEKKARKKENDRLSFVWQKAKPVVDPEVEDEKIRRKREYHRKWRQQLLANATPEQREQRRLKELENVRRQRKNESEEQRERRCEQKRQYYRTVAKQRSKERREQQQLSNWTPQQREKKRMLEKQIENS